MSTYQKCVKGFALLLAFLIIISIFSIVMHGLGILIDLDANDRVYPDETTEITDYNKITRLDIDLGAVNLEIRDGEKFSVQKSGLTKEVEIKSSNNTLRIEEKKGMTFWTKAGDITITIPKSIEIDSLELDVGAGRVTMDKVTAEKFDFDQGAGTVTISDSNFNRADIDGGAGRMVISNSTMKDLDLDCGVGSIVFSGKILGRSRIEAGVGSLKLDIDGKREDYTLSLEKGLGSITVNGDATSGKMGNGEHFLEVDGGVGSININFSR